MTTLSKYNFKRIVIVAYRLPFKFKIKDGKVKATQNAGGLVSAILSLSQRLKTDKFSSIKEKTVWVGKGDNVAFEVAPEQISNDHFDIRPVFIPENINERFYGGFCNDLIWPLFHYFPSLAIFGNHYYDSYEDANRIFLEELKKVIEPGDFIWVHDYHLFLLPAMIREAFPSANVSFFLHIPFPSFEIFRILPREWRNSILKGLLGADLIGFHTNDYVQNFLKSVRRCLGYEVMLNVVHSEGHIAKADTFPIGIDYQKFHDTVNTAEAGKYIAKLKKQVKDHILIFSVDRLDYTKGFLPRLHAYELFLERNKALHGKIIFNMVIVPSRDTITRYQLMKKEIEATVGRINGKFSTLSWRPIIYQYRSLKFHEMIALYNQSDIALITPIRDGMNLVAKEFVASQHNPPGTLILSEMTGAAAELGEAILVNPSDIGEVADAIYQALTMDEFERTEQIAKMQSRLMLYDVFTWASDIINSTRQVKIEQEVFKVKYFNSLIEKEIVDEYRKSQKAVMFFDYDGTLVPIREYPELAVPENLTLELTEQLAKRDKVIIISGRDKKFLEKWFASLPVYLIAEHGAFFRVPGGSWQYEFDTDNSWKENVYPILQRYLSRCKGTFIEEKNASLCWHYRNADADLAALRTIELRDELMGIISNNTPLQIIDGHKVLEIKKAGYNKGTAAKKILGDEYYDFILAVGDDKTDEDLFSALPPHAYTMKVGKGPSKAKYNFQKQNEVIRFLNCLLKC